ncbi:MAG TPA: glycosyltransferase family 4 protein [Mucilaginibacter sp.]|nr:glycosyltransferase family 4 protein [Mucilaginibacter sp.]
MNVTLINTDDAGGGASAACMRLLKALESKEIDAQMQVQEKKTNEQLVESVATDFWSRMEVRFNFLFERMPFIWFRAKNRSVRFAFSPADIGSDITDQPAVATADLLHLHWTNGGFLSIKNLKQLFQMNKPMVWTLHDMWAFTGGCHYSGECDHFKNECGNCWMLRNPGSEDLSFRGLMRKKYMLKAAKKIVFVTPSHWLAKVAASSSLLKDFRIETIPNPIDTEIFSPIEDPNLRSKLNIGANSKVILFGAANILDRRKGLNYLVEALHILKDNYARSHEVEIVIFGKNKAFDTQSLPFRVHEAGIVRSQEEMAALYNIADVFVTPAIEDNLPNTVMEAMACATPVVAFNTGGIPDMIDHFSNGYLAEYQSSADFATGIRFVLNAAGGKLSTNARKKVLENFTSEIVAEKYITVYESLLTK